LSTQGPTNRDTPEVRTVIVSGGATGFAQKITVGPHRLSGDEPTAVGGTDTGPNPYDLLLAALGSCTSMTVAMYARRKQWPLEAVTVRLRHLKIHAADCESCEKKEGLLDRIEREVELVGPLEEEQRARLLEIANKCPVHRTLSSEIDIRTRLV
jgi:putative redox protein